MDRYPISDLVSDLGTECEDEILAIYGIGSYFDKLLPDDWLCEDIDVITIQRQMLLDLAPI